MPRSVQASSDPAFARHPAVRYALAVGIVGVATLLRSLVDPLIHGQIPYFIYVASVVVATWFCGIGAGLFSTVLAAFVGNYFFVFPRYQLVPHPEDWIAMSLFASVGAGLVWLVGRWRNAERRLQQQARELRVQGEDLLAQAERLRSLHGEAERVNRVKDEFLATLSHELRTPLNAIVGWAHLLAKADLGRDQQRSAAETILRNADNQVRLVDDLLDVSRIISGKLELRLAATDMAAVTGAAVDLVRYAAEAKGITLRVSVPPAAVLVGDAGRLQQIAWNLLSNAVKFTRKGGRVDVRVEMKDSAVVLTVSDTGIGIEPGFVPHLFERFSQADSSTTRQYGGLGLGLAVVRHLAELHGGTVSASSAGPDQGATFTVTLPVRAVAPGLQPDPAVEQHGPPMRSRPSPHFLRGLRVLVVDDEPDARLLVETVLAEYGAEVRVAASAHEAFLGIRDWRPDVLVADIGMPVEDGYSLLRRIRRLPNVEGGTIPAAALTAYAQLGDRERALAAGFQEHLPKPVTPERLADVVARLASRQADELPN